MGVKFVRLSIKIITYVIKWFKWIKIGEKTMDWWWLYVVISLALFVCALILNYVVKKINEFYLERRLATLRLKSPAGQVVQVQETALDTMTLKQNTSPVDANNLDDSKGKEIAITSVSLEKPSIIFSTLTKDLEVNDVRDTKKTEVIELTDFAQSTQFSDKSEFECHASTLCELNYNTTQVVILNKDYQRDLVLSITDESMAGAIDSETRDERQSIEPDVTLKTHEESQKTKLNASGLVDSPISKVIVTDITYLS